MSVSAIVPAYNSEDSIFYCLTALLDAGFDANSILVVNDASTDGTADICSDLGIRVISLAANAGPAAARNKGAMHTASDILLFVDADVAVAPDVKLKIEQAFGCDEKNGPSLDRGNISAVFGSYDNKIGTKNHVSHFRNLLHHHTHQQNAGIAHSFWTGIGAVRRSDFEAVGGFDEKIRQLEDVDFGARLIKTGRTIILDPDLQGTHLKNWNLWTMLRTDLFDRAIPWSRLIQSGVCKNGKIVANAHVKMSSLIVGSIPLALFAGAVMNAPLIGGLISVFLMLLLLVHERELLSTLTLARSPSFAICCFPYLLLFRSVAMLGYFYVSIESLVWPYRGNSR